MTAPLVAVCGPTGSGKSGLAVHLGRVFSGEVVNCDSLQVYRHFDIGTAKLPEREYAGVRHHLIDVVEAEESFTAGDYGRAGRAILHEITARGKLPLVAGGTGFYLRALLDGLPEAPAGSAAVRKRLMERERRRPGAVHRLLTRLDADSARRLHVRDVAKGVRALEIRLLTGRAASEHAAGEPLTGYGVLKLGLFPERAALYERLDRRAEAMLTGGLLEEVEQLLTRGVSREVKPFQSLGYKEALAVLDGRMTRAEALERMRRDTRRYAKRQMTWFRHEAGISALEGMGDDPRIQAAAEAAVRGFLERGLIDSQL